MNFLNPLVLLALAAAVIPLLLHFLTLRKLRPFPFSSIRFLKELQRSAARRFRLRQLLLLAVRIGLVVAIVLAFARPVLPGTVPLLSERAPASIVLVVDNSASMGVADAHGERFRQLQQVAERFLRSLHADDEVALLPVVPVPESVPESWGLPRGTLLQALSQLTPQPERGELLHALQRAGTLLQDARHFHRFVVLLSDFQKTNLAELSREQPRLFDTRTTVVALPIGQGEPLRAGLVIDSVALESQLRSPYGPVTFTARVRCVGQGTAQGVISLFWDGQRISQQALTLREGEVRTVSLSGTPNRTGFFRAEIVAEGDVQTLGNRRWAGFAVGDGPSVRFVLDETFRLPFEAILEALDAPVFLAEYATPQQLSPASLGSPVLLLASASLTPSQLAWLKAFLESGGKGFLFVPGKPSEALSAWVSQLGLKLHWHELPTAEAATITWIDQQHPLFAGVFQGSGELLPETPRLEKFATISGGIPLMKSTLGTVLVEHTVGKGRLLLCGIPPNMAWSDFPRSGLFPTTVVRGLLLLSSAALPTFFYDVGDRIALTLGTAPPTLIVREPDGTRRTLAPVVLSSGARVELGRLRIPGVYELLTPNGTPVATVTANIPAAELQLRFATSEDVAGWFRQLLNPAASFRYISTPEESTAIMVAESPATELWRYFLVLALLLAALEVVLSRSGQHEPQT